MLILTLIFIVLVQSILGEFMGESTQLIRLWLLLIVAIAFDNKKIRVLPVVATGLLIDGLYGSPTGFHVLELGFLYALVSLSIEHLGNRTFLSRAILGGLVGGLNLIITVVLGYCFSVTTHGEYLLKNIPEFLFTQSLSMALLLPIILKLFTSSETTDHRLNVDG
jgi:cell shape-determining protein MreD